MTKEEILTKLLEEQVTAKTKRDSAEKRADDEDALYQDGVCTALGYAYSLVKSIEERANTESAKIESEFSGTHLLSVSNDDGIQIAIGCITPEASALLDKCMEEWEEHFAKRKARNPKDEPSVYGFAYWLIRWSGLVRPANTEVKDAE